MTPNTVQADGIYSDFGSDPCLQELVELFVDEMPARIQRLTEAHAQLDRDSLRQCAHQLKGSGGSYGFSILTKRAHALELAILEEASEQQVSTMVGMLLDVCRRARAGR